MYTGKIGVSVISLFPISMGPGGPQRALWIARQAGYDGLQVVPLQGWREEDIRRLNPESVISYEGDWRKEGDPGDFKTKLLYGKREDSERRLKWFQKYFSNSLAVDTEVGGLVETSPVNFPHDTQYYEYEPGVVLDVYHTTQEPLITKDPVAFIQKLVKLKRIKLIHFQTRDKEVLWDFMNELYTDVENLLLETMMSNADIIVEVDPRMIFPNYVKNLRAIREAIFSLAYMYAKLGQL